MGFGIKLKVWGELAAFNRPEMKVERVSYDVITPSAARGILEAIYWKPQMQWVIDCIHVLAPIRFTHVRRNEISKKISPGGKVGKAMKEGEGALGICVDGEKVRQQRAAMVLRDVRYVIEGHVVVLDPGDGEGGTLVVPEAKHLEMFKRRARKGQYFHHPYLGCREFPADFELVDEVDEPCPEELRAEQPKDLGFMLHDIKFVEDPQGAIVESSRGKRLRAEPRFFRAQMKDGVIQVPPLDQARG